MSDVADLLAQSRAAHQRYRDNLPRMGPDRQRLPGDDVAAGAAMTEACRLRTEAGALDPDHLDPAWAEPANYNDEALLTFYAEQLSR